MAKQNLLSWSQDKSPASPHTASFSDSGNFLFYQKLSLIFLAFQQQATKREFGTVTAPLIIAVDWFFHTPRTEFRVSSESSARNSVPSISVSSICLFSSSSHYNPCASFGVIMLNCCPFLSYPVCFCSCLFHQL